MRCHRNNTIGSVVLVAWWTFLTFSAIGVACPLNSVSVPAIIGVTIYPIKGCLALGVEIRSVYSQHLWSETLRPALLPHCPLANVCIHTLVFTLTRVASSISPRLAFVAPQWHSHGGSRVNISSPDAQAHLLKCIGRRTDIFWGFVYSGESRVKNKAGNFQPNCFESVGTWLPQ